MQNALSSSPPSGCMGGGRLKQSYKNILLVYWSCIPPLSSKTAVVIFVLLVLSATIGQEVFAHISYSVTLSASYSIGLDTKQNEKVLWVEASRPVS